MRGEGQRIEWVTINMLNIQLYQYCNCRFYNILNLQYVDFSWVYGKITFFNGPLQ